MQVVFMSKVALLNVTSVAKARQVESITPPNGLSYVEESIARCSRLTRQHVPFLRSSSFGAFVNVSGNELETSIIKFANEHSIAVVRIPHFLVTAMSTTIFISYSNKYLTNLGHVYVT